MYYRGIMVVLKLLKDEGIMENQVSLNKVIKDHELIQINKCVDTSHINIVISDINRPALQLTGYFEFFNYERIQVIGMVEYTFMEKLSSEQRHKIFEQVCAYEIPCIILCRGFEAFKEMVDVCNQRKIPILSSEDITSDLVSELTRWLKVELAPVTTRHGVLVDIYGEGVLIMGESGVGKSETALELIKRGHRLVADDAVEIRKVSKRSLVGTCPEMIRFFIELRGIGIIDVKQMFGVESVKVTQTIDLIIELELWDAEKEYDRLGLEENYMEILGNKIVTHKIPVRPGRNLALICETAAINHRQKKMGYNAAQSLNDRIMQNMLKNSDVE